MIGTTRSRVSFFMNRFRKHGFIEYNGRIRVHKSLLNVILLDQPAGRRRCQGRPAGSCTGQGEGQEQRPARRPPRADGAVKIDQTDRFL